MSDQTNTSTAAAPSAPAGQTTEQPAGTPAANPTAAKDQAKAEILAKHAKARAAEKGATSAEPKTEAASDADNGNDGGKEKAPEPKTEAKPDRSVQTIAKLNTEIRDLKAKLAQHEGKPTAESKADFLAKVKANPSILFNEIDEPELLTKLAEARYRDLTPEEKAKHEVEEKIAGFEKKLADAEQAKKDAETKAFDQTLHSGTAQILNHGFKNEDGSITIDNSKWPLSQRLTKTGEADAPRMAMNIVTALTKDLGRAPNDRETATFLEIAFDQLEQNFSKKAEAYRLDAPKTEEPPKTTTVDRARDQRPKTISSRMATGGRTPSPPPKSNADKKAAILARHAQQRARERAAAA